MAVGAHTYSHHHTSAWKLFSFSTESLPCTWPWLHSLAVFQPETIKSLIQVVIPYQKCLGQVVVRILDFFFFYIWGYLYKYYVISWRWEPSLNRKIIYVSLLPHTLSLKAILYSVFLAYEFWLCPIMRLVWNFLQSELDCILNHFRFFFPFSFSKHFSLIQYTLTTCIWQYILTTCV